MPQPAGGPITVALVDDYDVVLMGVANMFDRYRDRVVVAELDATMAVDDPVDIVLYDSFAQPESDHHEIGEAGRQSTCTPSRGLHLELSSSSPAPANTEHTGICRRRCRHVSWSPRWRQCMPARWSSATFPHAGAAPWALTGPGGAKVSATENPRSSHSSPRARATPTWQG
jgi:hypothetical protein